MFRSAGEAPGRLLAGLDPAAGHDHMACLLDELAGGLEADTGVRAGDDVGLAGEVLRTGRLIDRKLLPRYDDLLAVGGVRSGVAFSARHPGILSLIPTSSQEHSVEPRVRHPPRSDTLSNRPGTQLNDHTNEPFVS